MKFFELEMGNETAGVVVRGTCPTQDGKLGDKKCTDIQGSITFARCGKQGLSFKKVQQKTIKADF